MQARSKGDPKKKKKQISVETSKNNLLTPTTMTLQPQLIHKVPSATNMPSCICIRDQRINKKGEYPIMPPKTKKNKEI
jgi:hypothetical protein